MKTFTKDPDEVMDFSIDWEPWLADNSDTISTSAYTVPAGITKDSESNTTLVTTVWLSGGSEDATYTIENRIVTAGGRTLDRSFDVYIVSA